MLCKDIICLREEEYVKYYTSDSFAVARKLLLGSFFPPIIRTNLKILLYISGLKLHQN